MIKTLKIKVKPQCHAWLNKAKRDIDHVFNYCNEVSFKAVRPFHGRKQYLSAFDLINLTSGSSKFYERIGSANISKTAAEVAIRKKQFKKAKLRWRTKKSLGWIPLKPEQIVKIKGNGFSFNKKRIRLFENIEGYKFKEGCFAQDSLGDWYLCVPVEIKEEQTPYKSIACGIDLGLKTVATASGGEKLESKFYGQSEKKLAQLQKRGHKKQSKYLHRKIKRQRDHAMHGFTTNIIKTYQNIYIGDVSFGFLKSGTAAKAAYDGSSSKLKTQLSYKGQQAGRNVQVISEKFTTQACSACGSLSGPAGRTGLVVREWRCSECGTEHDRDVNAAINICHLGMKHHPPFAGTNQACDEAAESAINALRGMDQRITCQA